MARIRVFIAVKFPEELKELLKEIQDEIRSGGRDPRSGEEQLKGKVSFVRADNFHLTLKFLGDTDESSLGAILNALRAAASEVPPFTLTAGSVEIRSGKVLWVPIEGGEALIRLNKALED